MSTIWSLAESLARGQSAAILRQSIRSRIGEPTDPISAASPNRLAARAPPRSLRPRHRPGLGVVIGMARGPGVTRHDESQLAAWAGRDEAVQLFDRRPAEAIEACHDEHPLDLRAQHQRVAG